MTEFFASLLAQIDYSNVNPCPLGGASCLGAADGDAYIQNLLFGPQGLKIAFGGLLLGMLIFYGIKLMVGSRSDNTLTEIKQAYGQALFGSIIVGGAILLADTFASGTREVVVEEQFNTVTNNVVLFLSGLIATAVLANIVVQGLRLIVSLEDGDIDKAKKGFLHGMIGAGIAILALSVVRTFTSVETTGGGGIEMGGVAIALQEALGIGQYLTLILGALSVFGIVIAGIMLVVSYDESLKDRARKLIIGSLISLAVSLVAFGLVKLFIAETAPGATLTFVQTAYAQPTEAINAIDAVSGNALSDQFVGENAGGVLTGIMRTYLPLANLIAVIILVITGLLLIIAQDENQISIARKTLLAIVASLVLINVAVPLSIGFTTGFEDGVGAGAGASVLSTEVLGFISFIEVPIATIAVIMIIISSIRAIATFGTDQGVTNLRRTVFAVIVGLVIISAKIALTTAIGANPYDVFIVGNPDSHPLIGVFVNMLQIILSFMALAAVIMIVIAGITLIVNKGDQEVVDKARGIIVRTLAGLFIILISAGLTMIVLG